MRRAPLVDGADARSRNKVSNIPAATVAAAALPPTLSLNIESLVPPQTFPVRPFLNLDSDAIYFFLFFFLLPPCCFLLYSDSVAGAVAIRK